MCCFTVFRLLSGESSLRRSHIKVSRVVKSVSWSFSWYWECVERLLLFIMTMGGIGSRKNVFLAFSSIWLALREGVSVCLSGCDFQVNLEGKRKYDLFFCFVFTSSYKSSVWKNETKTVFFHKSRIVVFGTSQWNHLAAKQPFPKET